MFHIYNKITELEMNIIYEGILIIIIINLFFAFIYYKLYQIDNNSFKNYHEDKEITFCDTIFYTFTLFFRSTDTIYATSMITKFIVIIQLIISFIVADIILVEIIKC